MKPTPDLADVFHVKQTPPGLAFLDAEIDRLDSEGLLRRPTLGTSASLLFCSNDYLGLAGQVAFGRGGAGASRLISGDAEEHRELEDFATSWLGAPACLVFSSGYAANVGTLAALARDGDLIISDALNHASLIDGARLSRAHVEVVPHLDLAAVNVALERWAIDTRTLPRYSRPPQAWVVTESYFSMDADTPDLVRLRAICDEHRAALYVDEAHALGVLGPDGRGLCAAAAITPDVLVGTLGKAFGSSGAFVVGCKALRTWLWNRARSFVFSTGLSPAAARAGLNGMKAARETPQLRERTLANAHRLREGLALLGVRTAGDGHVVPWLVGDGRRALRLAEDLRAQGLAVVAIRPPTVPPGTARIRLTVRATHSPADVDRLLGGVREVLAAERARGELRGDPA